MILRNKCCCCCCCMRVTTEVHVNSMPLYIYYIHTGKYSPKSYVVNQVVNFRTQTSSSQSEERTMVFTREKMIRPIRIANDVFHVWEKGYVQSEATEVCEFHAKIPAFYCSLQRCFVHIQRYEKSFTQRVFLAKKVKNISEMEWNGFVCFTVDKENGREPAKQQGKGINRTRRKLLL